MTDEIVTEAMIDAGAGYLDRIIDADMSDLRQDARRIYTAMRSAAQERALDDDAELIEALQFYTNPEIYKPHPHGPAFDNRDLSFKAKAVLDRLQSKAPETGERS
jgi:hypothetical protein